MLSRDGSLTRLAVAPVTDADLGELAQGGGGHRPWLANRKVYVANQNDNTVLVIAEQHVQGSPPLTAIMPLPGDCTIADETLFIMEAAGSGSTPVLGVYYQLDTWIGPWQRAFRTGVAGRWQGHVIDPSPGLHILYAFATDGQDATSVNTGQGAGSIVGSIAAYLFLKEPGNPIPSLAALDPPSALVHSSGFTLAVRGTDFVPGSVVRWNGADRPTTFVNGAVLRAAIGAGDLTAPGSVAVRVFNPAPGGGLSGTLPFLLNKYKVYMPVAMR